MIPILAVVEHNIGKIQSGRLVLPDYSDTFNCASLVRLICDIPDEGLPLSMQLSDCVERPIQYAKFGDVVFDKKFGHCGICVGYPYIMHYTSTGLHTDSYIYNFAGGYAYGS